MDTSTSSTVVSRRFNLLGRYDAKIFWPLTIVYLSIIGYAIFDPAGTSSMLTLTQNFILKNLSWLILLSGTASVFTCLWMLCSSRFSHMKLGAPEDKPEFSFFAWVAMLFCAALGTGFVIFGVAEPLFHIYTAVTVLDAGTTGMPKAVPEAIRLSIVNWSLFGWPMFAVGGWAIGYAAYRHGKPLRTSTGLYGLLGERCNDSFIGKFTDVTAGVATIGGVAMMIGLGVASISYALEILFGITLSATGKFGVILFLIVAYILSSVTGLAQGMRYLSETNSYLTLGLLLMVLVFGPASMVYLANLGVQSVGEFISGIPATLFWTDADNFEARPWMGFWFIFYILWMVTYIPFTGGFIARISKGRTMREYIIGAVLVPTAMTVIWFSIWGGTACFVEITHALPLWEAVQENPERGLYILLSSMPMGTILSFMAFICFCLFAITTADAASQFIAQQTSPIDQMSPGVRIRMFWGCVIGFTGILFQVTGGFAAIKSLAIVMASPFIFISFAYIVSIVKMMHQDAGIRYQ